MRTYAWWKKQKKRVQKKYTLFLGCYLSPKEVSALAKRLRHIISEEDLSGMQRKAMREANMMLEREEE